jgi:hypothetical protein
MTAATVVLFIFVSHGPGARPPDAVVQASLGALPEGGRAVVRTAPQAPADEAVAADAAAAGATVAVVVSWEGADLLASQVRAVTGLPAHARWVSRRVSFDPSDQIGERERALGLVIASIVDEGLEVVAAPAAPAAPTRAPPEPPGPATPSPPVPPWAVEAAVTTAFQSGNDVDDTIGGMIGLRRSLPHAFALRAALAFRLTEWDPLDVRTRTLAAGLGLAWTAWPYARPGAVGFGFRADLLAAHESVLYSSSAGGWGDEQSFSSFGADLVMEGGVGLSADTALMLGVGGEMLFTAADLEVEDRLAATLPRSRLILQIGILARF